MVNGGYTNYTPVSSLPGGPEASFCEPKWYAFFRIGVREHWTKPSTVAITRDVLGQFFLPTTEPVLVEATRSAHFGQCNVVSLFDLGAHECGLQLVGEELIPFAFRGGEGGSAKKEISSLAGGVSRPVVAFQRDWPFRIRFARHIPRMGGGVGMGIRL